MWIIIFFLCKEGCPWWNRKVLLAKTFIVPADKEDCHKTFSHYEILSVDVAMPTCSHCHQTIAEPGGTQKQIVSSGLVRYVQWPPN